MLASSSCTLILFIFLTGSIYRRGARRWRKLYKVNGHIFQAKRFNRVSWTCHVVLLLLYNFQSVCALLTETFTFVGLFLEIGQCHSLKQLKFWALSCTCKPLPFPMYWLVLLELLLYSVPTGTSTSICMPSLFLVSFWCMPLVSWLPSITPWLLLSLYHNRHVSLQVWCTTFHTGLVISTLMP